MNTVKINREGLPVADAATPPEWADGIESFTLAVLEKLKKKNWDLSLLFCDNKTIRNLNRQYRNRDEATDVLSFIMGETEGERFLPGDIAVSLEMVKENAEAFEVSPAEELRRLLIHGILHLSGMDHASNGKGEPMLTLQEQLLGDISEA